MEKRWIKQVAVLLLAYLATPTFAQQPEEGVQRERREIPSPENNARRITKEFKEAFQLTEADYEKVYELYLKQEKDMLPTPNGNRPQGGRGPMGGGMGGPGGGMGGFGGGPQMGGGMPPQGGFQPDGNMPQDIKERMEEMRKEQQQKREKAAKKLDKKMKKILKGEEYTKWQEWERRRISREETARQPERHSQQTQRQNTKY